MRHAPLLALALLAACGGAAPQAANGQAANETSAVKTPVSAATATPAVARVMDAAHLLTSEEVKALTAKSAALEQRTGHQFVVVTVTSLDGRDIAPYSTDLGNRLGIGRKGVNDGVLLVVAPVEHKVRIAVAEGLRKQLTDAEAKAIIDQAIVPSFRAKQFGEGIVKGSDRIVAEISETGA